MRHRTIGRGTLAWALVLSALSVGNSALAQQAGATDDAARAVDAALGAERPVLRRVVRHAGTAHDWTVALPTRRGTCYEIVGRASGASRVTVALQARRSRVAEPLPIATASGVARARFCASLPGAVYSALVHAEGPATWAIALHPAPAGEGATTASSPPPAASASPPTSSAPPAPSTATTFPIGGTESDYVGQQIRSSAQSRTPRAIVAAQRVELTTNQAHTVDLPLVASHCILAVVAAVPSATDVNLELSDPAGNRVAEDTGHRATETLSYCPPYSGTYRLSVRMFSGHGLTGIQAFEVH